MGTSFSPLEQAILQAKGMSDDTLGTLTALGVASKDDFRTIGDVATLRQLLPAIDEAVAGAVMSWATGASPTTNGTTIAGGAITVETSDVVSCVHCRARQPKDYSSGDLCTTCGKQAEPILSCYWCSSSGPGTFCRQCGAEFVATSDLDLATLLRREGIPKESIPERLRLMSQSDKDVLWGRVRKSRS